MDTNLIWFLLSIIATILFGLDKDDPIEQNQECMKRVSMWNKQVDVMLGNLPRQKYQQCFSNYKGTAYTQQPHQDALASP